MFISPSQWAGFAGDAAETIYRGTKGFVKSHPKGLGIAFFGLDLAVTMGTAKKGEFIEDTAGSVGGTAVAIGATTIGAAIGGPIGGIIGGFIGDPIGRMGAKSVVGKLLHEYRAGPNFGGKYKDTEGAMTMRQQAAREMGSSLLNARRYLGSEGILQHS